MEEAPCADFWVFRQLSAERAQVTQYRQQEPYRTDVRLSRHWECGRQTLGPGKLSYPGNREKRGPQRPEQELPLPGSQQRLHTLPPQPHTQRKDLPTPEKNKKWTLF